MSLSPWRALRWLSPALTIVLFLALFVPPAITAQEAGSSTAVTTAPLNMRSQPDISSSAIVVIPYGATVSVTGEGQAGFLPVSWNGNSGWSSADYLEFSGSGDSNAGSGTVTGSAWTTSPLNFRSGPDTSFGIVLVIPADAEIAMTGQQSGDFVSAIYNGYEGWVFSQYLSLGGPSPAPEPGPVPSTSGSMVASANLNMRSGAGLDYGVVTIIPAGSTVSVTGSGQNGFLPVSFFGFTGWASADFLAADNGSVPEQEPAPGAGGSGIIWPVSGGTWEIIQGYNGGTHQNRSASAQYYYALDIARTDGDTANQPIYAPASGTVLWQDAGSGGIAIDMGTGYTIAMFHGTFDSSLGRGTWVSQGQYIGTVSGAGGAGYASTPHIDMTLWRTADGGRSATPYTGAHTISGMSFPDIGGWNQYGGTTFNP